MGKRTEEASAALKAADSALEEARRLDEKEDRAAKAALCEAQRAGAAPALRAGRLAREEEWEKEQEFLVATLHGAYLRSGELRTLDEEGTECWELRQQLRREISAALRVLEVALAR